MDEMELLARELVTAWRRYRKLFGEDPHGTEQQMKALLALTPKYGADSIAGTCTTCGGLVRHRSGKIGEFDHEHSQPQRHGEQK